MPALVLLSNLDGAELSRLAPVSDRAQVVRTPGELEAAVGDGSRVLLSFSTGVIVPAAVFSRFGGGAYNLHPATPDYPGRDPHHFAAYDGVGRYGATLHRMTARVDDGPIVDVQMADAPRGAGPAALLDIATAAAAAILERAVPLLLAGERLAPLPGVSWGAVKRTRADFLAMCRIDPDMPREEVERRFHAFDGGVYDNLFLELHGYRFRIDKGAGPPRD